MPSIEDVTKVLSNMDKETYIAAVKYIYYLAQSEGDNGVVMSQQQQFLEDTLGKVEIDENAVNNLRTGCMI